MPKLLILVLSIFSISGFPDHPPIDYPWETLQCSSQYLGAADDFIHFYTGRLNAAKTYKENCGSGAAGDCILYLVNKGYSPSNAKSYCEGINDQNYACFKFLVEKGYSPSNSGSYCKPQNEVGSNCLMYLVQKGYSPSNAGSYCTSMNTEPELKCLKFTVEKGYSPSNANSYCDGFTTFSAESCYEGLVNKGYSPSSASATCLGSR